MYGIQGQGYNQEMNDYTAGDLLLTARDYNPTNHFLFKQTDASAFGVALQHAGSSTLTEFGFDYVKDKIDDFFIGTPKDVSVGEAKEDYGLTISAPISRDKAERLAGNKFMNDYFTHKLAASQNKEDIDSEWIDILGGYVIGGFLDPVLLAAGIGVTSALGGAYRTGLALSQGTRAAKVMNTLNSSNPALRIGAKTALFGAPEAATNIYLGKQISKARDWDYTPLDAVVDGALGAAFGVVFSKKYLTGLDSTSPTVPGQKLLEFKPEYKALLSHDKPYGVIGPAELPPLIDTLPLLSADRPAGFLPPAVREVGPEVPTPTRVFVGGDGTHFLAHQRDRFVTTPEGKMAKIPDPGAAIQFNEIIEMAINNVWEDRGPLVPTGNPFLYVDETVAEIHQSFRSVLLETMKNNPDGVEGVLSAIKGAGIDVADVLMYNGELSKVLDVISEFSLHNSNLLYMLQQGPGLSDLLLGKPLPGYKALTYDQAGEAAVKMAEKLRPKQRITDAPKSDPNVDYAPKQSAIYELDFIKAYPKKDQDTIVNMLSRGEAVTAELNDMLNAGILSKKETAGLKWQYLNLKSLLEDKLYNTKEDIVDIRGIQKAVSEFESNVKKFRHRMRGEK